MTHQSADGSAAAPVLTQAQQRKNDHIRLADAWQERFAGSRPDAFADIALIRPALPESRVDTASIACEFFGSPVAAPFFINAMTGGTDQATQINQSLARVAAKQGLAMAFGSANLIVKRPDLLDGFVRARACNPDGPMLINVNPTTPLPTVKQLIDALNPVAAQVHVNAAQEIVMDEGDRDFHWLNRIRTLAQAIDVPVIVKEVGFGFDVDSMVALMDAGIRAIDVAGYGGTDFTWIEGARSSEQAQRPSGSNADRANADNAVAGQAQTGSSRGTDMRSLLAGAGLSTVKSLVNARIARQLRPDVAPEMTIIGSGGVRTPMDVLKCLALGARYVGVSGEFLHVLLHEGEDGLNRHIARWKNQLAQLFAVYGVNNVSDATAVKWYSASGSTLIYAQQMRAIYDDC